MDKFEQLLQRMHFLREFDKYVHEVIGDDNITEYWLTYGLPDNWSFEDLSETAKDDDLWLETVYAFEHCIHAELKGEENYEEED